MLAKDSQDSRKFRSWVVLTIFCTVLKSVEEKFRKILRKKRRCSVLDPAQFDLSNCGRL